MKMAELLPMDLPPSLSCLLVADCSLNWIYTAVSVFMLMETKDEVRQF